MGQHSGSDLMFDLISKKLDCENIFINDLLVPSKTLLRRFLEKNHLIRRENLWTNKLSSINGIKEIFAFSKAVKFLKSNHKSILIISCGEEQLTREVSALDASVKSRIFILLHQPISWYDNELDFINYLEGLGGIFVFSSSLKRYLERFLTTRVHSIFHGVDQDFFKPGYNLLNESSKSIICIGSWFRDFSLLRKLWIKIFEYDQSLNLTLIASEHTIHNSDFAELLQLPNVSFKYNLSSEKLLEYYRGAKLHILPLLDSIANNALVESLSTSCPLIISDSGSASEYLPSDHYGLCKMGDVDDHYNKTIRLLTDFDLRQKMAKNQLDFARINLNWSHISQKLIKAL